MKSLFLSLVTLCIKKRQQGVANYLMSRQILHIPHELEL